MPRTVRRATPLGHVEGSGICSTPADLPST